MASVNRPQFWLQIKKDYILDNFENLINYLSRYEYYPTEDNSDFDSTIECMRQLAEEISRAVDATPLFRQTELAYDRVLVIRLLCAHILASYKAGHTEHRTIMTLASLLAQSDINYGLDTLTSIYDIIVNCIRRRRLVNTGFTWNDIASHHVNDLAMMYRVRIMRFADAAPGDPSYFLENNGLLVIRSSGIPDLSLANKVKYTQRKFEKLFELPRLMRVLTDKENFEYADEFGRLYHTMQRLVKMQESYKPVAMASRETYTYQDSFPVRITSKYGWRLEAETIDPRYHKISGKLLLEMPLHRPKMRTINEMLETGDIIMVYPSAKEGYSFEVYDAFEDYYRRYACGCASQNKAAVFGNYYAKGTQWITEDGLRVGIDRSKADALDEEESRLFTDAIENRTPILLRTYKEAPDVNKEDFYVYGEPYDLSDEACGDLLLTADSADRNMIRNFIEYSRTQAEECGAGHSVGELKEASAEECSLLIPIIHRIGNSGVMSCRTRLEYNTACAMLCIMTGRNEDLAYIDHENRYLHELVKFASDKEMTPLPRQEILSGNPESEKRERIVSTLMQYKKKDVLHTGKINTDQGSTDILSKVGALVSASNSLIDIIDESELNNIKQSIARMLHVEDEYVSILDDRTYYGVESINLEFKSSVVFPPYNQRKSPEDITDPELQKWAIIKAVCGFLNSRSGGDLLIGVNDAGYAIGLDYDIQKLHQLRYISSPDADHYRLYVQRILTRAFAETEGNKDPSEIANTHIDSIIETNAEGRTVLRIKIRPYSRCIVRLAADSRERPAGIEESYVRRSGRTVVITQGMKEEIMKYKK